MGFSLLSRRAADHEAIDTALAQGRPGEVLRNLLFIAHKDDEGWRKLNATIGRLFSCQLEPPRSGAELSGSRVDRCTGRWSWVGRSG